LKQARVICFQLHPSKIYKGQNKVRRLQGY
jgi:hypothetical protein